MSVKKTLSAKDIMADIRADISTEELLIKYSLSTQGFHFILEKLAKAGLLSQAELDHRSADLQTADESDTGTVACDLTLKLWKCPACHMPQSREFEECPQCGVLVTKFLAKQVKARQQTQVVKIEELTPVQVEPQIQEPVEEESFPRDATPQLGKVIIQVDLDAGVQLAKGLLNKAKESAERVVNSLQTHVGQHIAEETTPVGPPQAQSATEDLGTPTPSFPSDLSNRSADTGSDPKKENNSRGFWRCPACKMPQTEEHQECPQCGVIVAMYLAAEERDRKEKGRLKRRRERRDKVIHVLMWLFVPLGLIGSIRICTLASPWGYLVLCAGILFAVYKIIYYLAKGRFVPPDSSTSALVKQGFSSNKKLAVATSCILVFVVASTGQHIVSERSARQAAEQAQKAERKRQDQEAIRQYNETLHQNNSPQLGDIILVDPDGIHDRLLTESEKQAVLQAEGQKRQRDQEYRMREQTRRQMEQIRAEMEQQRYRQQREREMEGQRLEQERFKELERQVDQSHRENERIFNAQRAYESCTENCRQMCGSGVEGANCYMTCEGRCRHYK